MRPFNHYGEDWCLSTFSFTYAALHLTHCLNYEVPTKVLVARNLINDRPFSFVTMESLTIMFELYRYRIHIIRNLVNHLIFSTHTHTHT